MGTRSTTYILDDNSHVLVCQYTQHDGYPEGVGKDIADVLTAQRSDIPDTFKSSNVTVDGTQVPIMLNNGMECLAASFIKFRKENPMGVYLYPVPRIVKLDFYDVQGRLSILDGLAEHASRNGSDYMYVIYHDKDTRLHNMTCCYLHDPEIGTAVKYDGPVYKFYEYLEEQKRKAEECDEPPSAALIPGEFADIEAIAMPEYD